MLYLPTIAELECLAISHLSIESYSSYLTCTLVQILSLKIALVLSIHACNLNTGAEAGQS